MDAKMSGNVAGELDFDVSFSSAEPRVKSSPFCYSVTLDKLYVQIEKSCPAKIQVNIPADQLANFRLRTWVEFKDFPDNPVHCCSTHKKAEKAGQSDGHSGDGIVRCDNASAAYQTSGIHHSAVVGLNSLAPDSFWAFRTSVNYKFTCLSSCISLRRRPMTLNIALEDIRLGLEVGRRSLNLSTCLCPVHDMKIEEDGEAVELDDFNCLSISTE